MQLGRFIWNIGFVALIIVWWYWQKEKFNKLRRRIESLEEQVIEWSTGRIREEISGTYPVEGTVSPDNVKNFTYKEEEKIKNEG